MTHRSTQSICLSILLLSLLFAVGSWISESLIHVYIFKTSDLSSGLWPDNSNEFWMRSIIAGLYLLLGIVISGFVSAHLKMKETIILSEAVFDSLFESLIISDANNHIIFVNSAFEETTGYSSSEVLGKTPHVLSSGRQDKAFYIQMWETLNQNGRWQGEIWNRRKNGEIYPEWLSIAQSKNTNGQVIHYIAIFTDITSKKMTENKIRHYAYHDPLTNLANRRMFEERLLVVMDLAKRNDQFVAISFIDLDGFKQINDHHGHLSGDLFLIKVAQLIQKSLRSIDLLARVGGDEFLILMPNFSSSEEVKNVLQRLSHQLSQERIQIEGLDEPIQLSIGVAIYPKDGIESKELLERADQAMYHVKKNNKNGVCFWSKDMLGPSAPNPTS